MNLKLRFIGGKHAGKEIDVRGENFLIGRGEQCHLRPVSDLISRQHFALMIESQQVRIVDLGSSNGTFVNGARLRSEQVLSPGDRVRVGVLEFSIHFAILTSEKAVRDTVASGHDTVSTLSTTQDDVLSWLTDTSPYAGSLNTNTSQPEAHSADASEVQTPVAEPASQRIVTDETSKSRRTSTDQSGKLTDTRQAAAEAIGEVMSQLEKKRRG